MQPLTPIVQASSFGHPGLATEVRHNPMVTSFAVAFHDLGSGEFTAEQISTGAGFPEEELPTVFTDAAGASVFPGVVVPALPEKGRLKASPHGTETPSPCDPGLIMAPASAGPEAGHAPKLKATEIWSDTRVAAPVTRKVSGDALAAMAPPSADSAPVRGSGDLGHAAPELRTSVPPQLAPDAQGTGDTRPKSKSVAVGAVQLQSDSVAALADVPPVERNKSLLQGDNAGSMVAVSRLAPVPLVEREASPSHLSGQVSDPVLRHMAGRMIDHRPGTKPAAPAIGTGPEQVTQRNPVHGPQRHSFSDPNSLAPETEMQTGATEAELPPPLSEAATAALFRLPTVVAKVVGRSFPSARPLADPIDQPFPQVRPTSHPAGIDLTQAPPDMLQHSPHLPLQTFSGPPVLSNVAASTAMPQLAALVAWSLERSAPGTTEIALSPEELGQVRLIIQPHDIDPTRVVVMMSFERPEVMDLFRRHADLLLAEIRSSGFSGVELGFAQSDPGGQGHPAQDPVPERIEPSANGPTGFSPTPPFQREPTSVLDLRL